MSKHIVLLTTGTVLDRWLLHTLQRSLSVLEHAGVHVVGAQGSRLDPFVGGPASRNEVVRMTVLPAQSPVAVADGLAALITATGPLDTMEVHCLLVPYLDHALDEYAQQVASNGGHATFSDWLRGECEIPWRRLHEIVMGVAPDAVRFWAVARESTPVESWLQHVLEPTPRVLSALLLAQEDSREVLGRPLDAWELELVRTCNESSAVTPGPAVARHLRRMSAVGEALRVSAGDLAVALARFGSDVEYFSSDRLYRGQGALVAEPATVSHVGVVDPVPYGTSPDHPPSLASLDSGDRMQRAVLALLLAGGRVG